MEFVLCIERRIRRILDLPYVINICTHKGLLTEYLVFFLMQGGYKCFSYKQSTVFMLVYVCVFEGFF
jgi:hypothetical protein